MPTFDNGPEVTALAQRLRDEAIVPGSSLFTERAVWTPAVFAELHAAYVGRPDESGSSFDDKLRIQLADVSDDACILFSELLLLNLIILGNLGADRKLALIRVPLELVDGEPVEVPSSVVATLEAGGVLHGGQGMNHHRWRHLVFLVEWGLALAGLPRDRREAAFYDGDAVEDTVYNLVPGENLAMRRALCFLLAPETHEPIISQSHLTQITRHFADRIPAELAGARMQRQAAAIRTAIAAERDNPDWDFYHDRDEWASTGAATPQPATGTSFADDADATDEDVTDTQTELTFPAELADTLLVSADWLESLRQTWNAKRQIILQGPPGTGKTFLARRLAKAATGSPDQVEVVQFHPAYTYEDFFEGFRPVVSERGGARFALRAGPLRDLAARATADPARAHVLVIDEINRGNLAKIFGELYFLLEYRDDGVRLMYSQERFSLPENLFIIGTMNTADRSIALVDAAMRRRFAFVTLTPDREPTVGLLRRWSAAAPDRPEEPVALLAELNRRIGDPARMVGPSYFMQHAVLENGGLERVWATEILPLLEETLYDEESLTDTYSLTAVRNAIQAEVRPQQTIDDSGASDGPSQ